MPFFRWVLTLGIVLIGCSAGVHMTVPDFPELEQLDLTVVEEAPDGRCTVRWTDPFEHHEEEGSYLCDADRDRALKAPLYDPETGFGWDSGFVVAEGKDKGELYSLEEDGAGADARIDLSDTLIAFGLLATAIGLVGGNIRATARLGGVRPAVVRRAARLSKAAALVAEDHDRATEEVREAWAPLHGERVREELGRVPISRLPWVVRLRSGDLEKGGIRTVRDVLDAEECKLGRLLGGGRPRTDSAVAAARRIADDARDGVAVRFEANRYEPRTTALLVAVQVLVDAGPKARDVAEAGRALAARLEPLLDDAEAASGYAHMLGAGPRRRRRARAAVRRLRALLEEAERDGVTERFGQVSVDLLRGQDSDPTGLDAWVDFDTRPAEYYRVLADVTGRKLSSAT
ncbi:hypothetical protein [Streptomyces salyersiae]|uniref:Bifunctional protein n=1 Tax=Streptomyces salyersiae TaxID=3075530 RepID=A0ABU2REV2_9ACTN|nr:hypothetical protein [Streptomyces sp. DSM 41770]MDT0426828.1 hypothetical protein [Streptomyces sp. DSM 41770]